MFTLTGTITEAQLLDAHVCTIEVACMLDRRANKMDRPFNELLMLASREVFEIAKQVNAWREELSTGHVHKSLIAYIEMCVTRHLKYIETNLRCWIAK
jgi:hypothetical protein